MNVKVISRNIGYALLVSALFMFFSVLVSVRNGNDSALAALLISFVITFIAGIFPFIFVRKTGTITLQDGYMIIVLSWMLSFIFGMLPYLMWGGGITVIDAWFESVSGYTTTGGTILEDVEQLPKSLLFWRSSTHFIGGLGIVVFLLLIIPSSSPAKLRLSNMELSSLSREGYHSRTNKTISIFASVYLGLTVLAFLVYWAAGMSPFDAVNHAFSVCATGGFSTHNLSIGWFASDRINLITIVFMIVVSLHFGMLYMVVVTRSLRPLNNPVLKLYLGMMAAVSLAIAFSLKTRGIEAGWGRALMNAAFHTVSYASTTGFAIADNISWPLFARLLLLIAGIQCGMAGSTTGGLKSDRVLVLFRAAVRQTHKIIHPSSVSVLRMSRTQSLREEEVYPHLLYIGVFFLFLIFSVVLCLALTDNSEDAIAGSISMLTNVGPPMSSMGNFNALPATVKFIFSLDMFLGRIEIYPVLAVLSMIFPRLAPRNGGASR